MSTYTVTTSPAQLYDGSQGAVTIQNQGPATVYLDSQSSVTPSSGWILPPDSVVRWEAGRALWACTEYDSCRLNVNNVGMYSDQGNLSVQRRVYQMTDPTSATSHATETFEVGGYSTLFFRAYTATDNVVIGHDINWYDSSRELLITERVFLNKFTPGIYSLNIPVKGAYCQISMDCVSPWTLDQLKVYGSTRILPYTAQNYTASETSGAGIAVINRGVVSYTDADTTGVIELPSWGVNMTVAGSLTGAGATGLILVTDAILGVVYGSVSLAANSHAQSTFNVPSARPLQSSFFGFTTGDINVIYSWSDYV